MINIYTFEKYDYVCANQDGISNLLQNGGIVSEGGFYIESQTTDLVAIEETVRELVQRDTSTGLLVWDMRRVSANGMRDLYDVLSKLYEKTYRGVCFLFDRSDRTNKVDILTEKIGIQSLNERINEAIDKISKESRRIKKELIDDTCIYCGYENELRVLNKHIGAEHDIFSVVDDDINKYIFMKIRTEGQEVCEENPSSNVYVNRYFDAKKILTNGSTYNLVIYRMALMILRGLTLFKDDKNNEKDQFDAFICASLTGACLAAGLSAIFKKPVIYVKNVGPQIMANDGRTLARIRPDNRYVFIYDFMCLGKEYERMKMICNLCSAKLISCAGISYYRLPRFRKADPKNTAELKTYRFAFNADLKISALFHVNAFNSQYYRCDILKRNNSQKKERK